MPEENKKKTDFDIFIKNHTYPDAASIFTDHYPSIESIKDKCCIVLDTNVLLIPYILGKEDPGKEDLLDQCKKTYKNLIEQKRLFIPGQVAREFTKLRVTKLSELYQQFARKRQQTQKIQKGKYPLLYTFDEYKEIEALEEKINGNIQEYYKALDRILLLIQNWQVNDPVRLLYHEIFTREIIIDPDFKEEEIKEDLNRRIIHNIPPGYKDAAKPDNGIGDLLIWHTILEIGKSRQQNIIFVSGDSKPDWFQQSEKTALYIRPELVDEYRRASEGGAIYIIKFSRFLELYDAKEEIIEEVKKEERQINTSTQETLYVANRISKALPLFTIGDPKEEEIARSWVTYILDKQKEREAERIADNLRTFYDRTTENWMKQLLESLQKAKEKNNDENNEPDASNEED